MVGGAGLGDIRGFGQVRELAAALGAEVGATRPPVLHHWVEEERLIGQTGKTVSPKLYFAIGISGAIQHLVGMQTSDIIIAINKDPEAPIFNISTFGVVGDLFKILPALIDELRKIRQ